MSLILEALKKLDREKQAPDRGLVVVGPAAWPSVSEGRTGMVAGAWALGILAVAVVGGAVWIFQGGRHPAPSSSTPATPVAGGVPAAAAGAAPAPAALPPTNRSAAQPPAPSGGNFGSLSRPAGAPSSKSAPASSKTGPASATGSGETSGAETVAANSAKETAEPRPARAKEPRPAGAEAYQLQAISAQEGHPVAILNDHLVREGDSFDGVKVLRIGADEVEIEVAGRRRVLKF